MNSTERRVNDEPFDRDSASQNGLKSYTIFWKENPSVPRVRMRTIQATDLEMAKEAAQFLVFEASNTVAVVLAVVED